MATTQPLIAHNRPEATLAWSCGAPIPARQFLQDVSALVQKLPPGRHVLNLCMDRYHFSVALAASIISNRINLLPSTQTPEMFRQMRTLAADVFCITDQVECVVDLPTFHFDMTHLMQTEAPETFSVPEIPVEQVIAQVFTSGSTGLPVPHPKRWGSLVENVRAEAERLEIGSKHAILGTVPAQHMYGLESTVLLPWQSGATLYCGKPFYPADICTALASLPNPRLLVTTPYHLRTLLADQPELPKVDALLSATASLQVNIAEEAETRFSAPLYEIYGCTETGQLASRQPTRNAEWQTLGDVHLRKEGEQVWAEGGHIDIPICLNDIVELVGKTGDAVNISTTFLLHGRHADLVNIAGKRTSLGYLNHLLNSIPGVHDGVFLQPKEDSSEGVGRLTALVVAPELTPATLMQALRERIDPIFLPRPLLFVDALPRNATGKLPNQLAQDLIASLHEKTALNRVSA